MKVFSPGGRAVYKLKFGALAAEVEQFLAWRAAERKVAAATHKQALSALLFFYGKVQGVDLPWLAKERGVLNYIKMTECKT